MPILLPFYPVASRFAAVVLLVAGWLNAGVRIQWLSFGLAVAVVAVYRFVPPPMTFLMIERMVQGHGFDRRWVPLRSISPRRSDEAPATAPSTSAIKAGSTIIAC